MVDVTAMFKYLNHCNNNSKGSTVSPVSVRNCGHLRLLNKYIKRYIFYLSPKIINREGIKKFKA